MLRPLRFLSLLLLLLALTTTQAQEEDEDAAPSETPQLGLHVYEGPSSVDGAKCASIDETISEGDQVTIHYTVSIDESSETGEKGRVLQTTKGSEPLSVVLGQGEVIPGWDEGMMGLCKGDKAILVVPPHLAYGDHGTGDEADDIPGGATLKFDVEILSVDEPEERDEESNAEETLAMFEKADKDENGKLDRIEFMNLFEEQLVDVDDEEELALIREQLEQFWNGQDKDEDGFLSKEEFMASQGEDTDPEAEFEALDKDGDGKLNPKEIEEFFADLGQEIPEDFWEHLDEDQDGFISFAEFYSEGDEDYDEDDEDEDEEGDEL